MTGCTKRHVRVAQSRCQTLHLLSSEVLVVSVCLSFLFRFFVLHDESGEHNRDEEKQENDALDWPGALLVVLGFVQLPESFLGVLHNLQSASASRTQARHRLDKVKLH